MSQKKTEIGRSSPTTIAPNTTELFRFNLEPGTSRVAPFDIVVAHSENQGDTFGIVTELVQTGAETSVAEARVLWNSVGSSLPVASGTSIAFPDPDGIQRALGMADIPEERRIPAGLIEQSDGTRAVAFLDSELVAGPAAGHLNLSGLAPRAPYLSFFRQSLQQRLRRGSFFCGVETNNRELLRTLDLRERVLDKQEGWEPLTLDWESWLHRAPLPFSPANSQVSGSEPYAYDLKYTASKLDLLLANIPDLDRSLALLSEEVARGLMNSGDNAWIQVQRWSDLWNRPPLVQQGIPQSFRGATAREVARFLNLLRRRVESRSSEIFVDHREPGVGLIEGIVGSLSPDDLYVIDATGLALDDQYLVVGDLLREGLEHCSGKQWLSQHLTFTLFLDDLDRFAGSWIEPTDPVLRELFEIVERGPGMGMTLIGAQQSISDLHPRLAAKFTTRLFGRGAGGAVDPAIGELLAPGLRGQLSRLEPDQLILTHPVYRHPVKIRYPRFV